MEIDPFCRYTCRGTPLLNLREKMADREVSWEEEEGKIVSVSVSAVPAVAAPIKREEEPVSPTEWCIDTRGDLPTERVIESSNTYGNGPNSTLPAWPEEQDMNAPHPLGRRVGRDPVNSNGYSNSGRDSGRNFAPRDRDGPRDNARDGPRDRKPSEGGRSKRIDDLSTLNLPGVDLSKMPSATTGLSFSNKSRDQPREPRSFNRESYDHNQGDADLNVRVDRVCKEVEELGWGEPEENITSGVAAPVSNNVPIAPVSNNEPLGWGDEPEPIKPVEQVKPIESIRQAEQVKPVIAQPTFKPVQSTQKPVIVNATERLEDDGWGDEPEEVHVPVSAPVAVPAVPDVKPVAAVPVAAVPVSTPVAAVPFSNPITAPAAVPVVSNPITAPAPLSAKVDAPTASMAHVALATSNLTSSASSEQMQHPAFTSFPSSHGYMPMYGGQMPYMMNPSMSPTQMGPPMSMMPGMMMPIWVTCPFCYHCYIYPPVAPGSGPAPGATTVSPSNN